MTKRELKNLYISGYLSPYYFYHKEILDKRNQLVASGMKNGQAVREIAKNKKVTRQYIYRIINQINHFVTL